MAVDAWADLLSGMVRFVLDHAIGEVGLRLGPK